MLQGKTMNDNNLWITVSLWGFNKILDGKTPGITTSPLKITFHYY